MASPHEPTSVEPAPDPARQALLEVSKKGAILWSAPEANAWWETTAETLLAARAFTSLFTETAELPQDEAWARLLERASAGGTHLTARTPSDQFEVFVQLTAKGELNESGEDSYIASIERSDTPPPTSLPPSEPATVKRRISPTIAVSLAADEAVLGADLPADDTLEDDALPEPELELETEPEPEPDVSFALDDELAAAAATDEPETTTLDDSLELPLPATVGRRSMPPAERPPPSIESSLEGAHLGFFHIDLADGTARFSDSWKSLLGYEPEDVADEPDSLAALVHPDDSEASPHALNRTGPFSAEIRLRTKDDGWRWMQLEGICAGERNRPSRIEGIMLDAQERHDADEETARNEERFLRLTGRGTAGFFEIDFVHEQAWFSPEFRRALGHRTDELGATPDGFQKVLPPEDAAVGVSPFFQSVSSGLPVRMTRYQLIHADGRAIDFDVFLAVRRNRRGVIEHVSGLQAPSESPTPAESSTPAPVSAAGPGGLAEAIQAALDAALEPIVLIDPRGRILHVNARAAAFVGETPDRLATRSIHEVYTLVARGTGAPAPEVIDRVLSGAQPLELDQSCSLLGRDGPEQVAVSCRPIIDQRRQLTGATVVFRRLADMPLSQAELVKSNRMEALGGLACGIVHDFNNLLSTVVGGVSLAIDKRDLTPLDTALKACNNAKNLARQLLTFARGDVSGRRVQSLNDIIRETARMAGAGSKTTVELELSADLHPVNVVTSQLVQVFTNLILNAMQVMPSGGRIWVRTLNMPLGQVNSVNLPPGDYVRADVQDNGPGIPGENLDRIFEPFFTTRAEGTGLGLAMVNSIVAQHEGAIEAASTVGSGTTFTLYFPRAQTEAVQEAPQKISMSYGTGRVLIMDDDADLCAIASGMLDMLGYKADAAMNADETIAKFRKSRELNNTYAAVILDLTMAGGPGGEDVIGRLREIDPAVKAIVSSGYATDENADHYIKLGFSGILSKPYRSADLGRVLKEVIGPPK